jgi:peroxiredoxin
MMRMLVSLSIVAVTLIGTGCQKAISKSPDAAASTKADEKKGLTIGDQGPTWENLTGTDDKQHSLKDLEKSKAVAIVFTCNTCPVAQAYEDRLMKLASDYKEKGVSVVAINVNQDEHNNLDAMKERAEKKGLTYDYLTDPSQQSARGYGATCTPHVFLLDKDRKIAYTGAIDDNMNADEVKQHSLQDAIDAVLEGKAPGVAETKQFGCGIRYE